MLSLGVLLYEVIGSLALMRVWIISLVIICMCVGCFTI